jgi:hypothetical protein
VANYVNGEMDTRIGLWTDTEVRNAIDNYTNGYMIGGIVG